MQYICNSYITGRRAVLYRIHIALGIARLVAIMADEDKENLPVERQPIHAKLSLSLPTGSPFLLMTSTSEIIVSSATNASRDTNTSHDTNASRDTNASCDTTDLYHGRHV